MAWDPIADLPLIIGTIIASALLAWIIAGRTEKGAGSWSEHFNHRLIMMVNLTQFQWIALAHLLSGVTGVWEGPVGNAFVLFSVLLWPVTLFLNFSVWLTLRRNWKTWRSSLACHSLLLSWIIPLTVLISQMIIIEYLRKPSFSMGYLHGLGSLVMSAALIGPGLRKSAEEQKQDI
ncbi:MAG: hypothetical protein CVV64_13090 [Candidatus Wallbacteria bacterium HGW-Wallbacteria-1]|jgi:hypothetical protein|uniref:Uncharacterized protein n=1 Tax=Candidatus Wallbacteria bacterium HGW-Wallbacteria-1 TaxID=2013854 RepID=A0A2N1PN01_9BACT|nr:MAG: hypothetical protein CVV64_13090 [Candidatus Wallbacteria bacterium HGW-Wallbacteria-1]